MDGHCDGELESQHGGFCHCGCGADEPVGEEEGGKVQEGIWGEVPEKEICDVAWNMVA